MIISEKDDELSCKKSLRSPDQAGQRFTFRGRARACSNKMASASATLSSRNLQLIEGNSDKEHRLVPSKMAVLEIS